MREAVQVINCEKCGKPYEKLYVPVKIESRIMHEGDVRSLLSLADIDHLITDTYERGLYAYWCSECGHNEVHGGGSTKKSLYNDSVNHPAHYTDGKIEVIDYIEDKGFSYHLGNAIKYLSRAGKKDPDKRIEDLKKAVWYINRQISLWEGGEPS